MGCYITIPREYEIQLQDLADTDMRSFRQEAAFLLCRGIEIALREREMTRQRHFEEVLSERE